MWQRGGKTIFDNYVVFVFINFGSPNTPKMVLGFFI